jgi:hypothetical protein
MGNQQTGHTIWPLGTVYALGHVIKFFINPINPPTLKS